MLNTFSLKYLRQRANYYHLKFFSYNNLYSKYKLVYFMLITIVSIFLRINTIFHHFENNKKKYFIIVLN